MDRYGRRSISGNWRFDYNSTTAPPSSSTINTTMGEDNHKMPTKNISSSSTAAPALASISMNGNDMKNNDMNKMIPPPSSSATKTGKNHPSFTIILRRKLPVINPLNIGIEKNNKSNQMMMMKSASEQNQKSTNASTANYHRNDGNCNADDQFNNIQSSSIKTPENELTDFIFSGCWQLWINENNEYNSGDWNVKRFGKATNSAKQFWLTYMEFHQTFNHENMKNLMIFRDSIEPKWEDQCNIGGGRWFFDVSYHGQQSQHDFLIKSNCWTQCMQAVMSKCLGPLDNLIVGMILHFKSSKYRVSLWIRANSNFNQIIELGKRLQKLLNLRCQIKFELHTGAANSFNGLNIDSSEMEIKK